MNKSAKKCKHCKGKGCFRCEHSGIELYSEVEEQFDDATVITGDKLYPDNVGFLDIEEEDYEV